MYSLRNLSTNILCHSFFHFLIFAYCIVNPSVLNIILLLLQVADILSIKTLPEFSQEKEKQVSCRRKQISYSVTPKRISDPTCKLLSCTTDNVSGIERTLLYGDKNSYTWLRLYPAIWVRKAIFFFFAGVLLLRLFFAVLGHRDWEGLSLTLRQIIYAINGGESAFHTITLEYIVMVFITFVNMVGDILNILSD